MDAVGGLNPLTEFNQGQVGLFLHGGSNHGTTFPQDTPSSAGKGAGGHTAGVTLSLAPLIDRRLADAEDLGGSAQRLLVGVDNCQHTFT